MADTTRTDFLTLHELVRAARQRLDARAWDYLVGGADTETTVHRNRLALDTIGLRPRVLRDVSSIDSKARFLGRPARMPVLLAPIGGLESFDPEGALAVARAAGRFGLPMMLSSVSTWGQREVRAAASDTLVFQLYVRGGEHSIERAVESAIEVGMQAFCFTVDSAVYSRRERDIVRRFDKPWRAGVNADSQRQQAALSWDDIARVRSRYDIPIMLKGIATAEDARIALDHGVAAVYVSNHGGRQLDHGLGTLDVLPEVVEAVAGRARVIVDGGISRGTDIVKALALGADFVGIGRLLCYGLGAAGENGLVRLLELLEEELRVAMGLLGVTHLGEIGRSHVRTGLPPAGASSVLGAFPLLDTGPDTA